MYDLCFLADNIPYKCQLKTPNLLSVLGINYLFSKNKKYVLRCYSAMCMLFGKCISCPSLGGVYQRLFSRVD